MDLLSSAEAQDILIDHAFLKEALLRKRVGQSAFKAWLRYEAIIESETVADFDAEDHEQRIAALPIDQGALEAVGDEQDEILFSTRQQFGHVGFEAYGLGSAKPGELVLHRFITDRPDLFRPSLRMTATLNGPEIMYEKRERSTDIAGFRAINEVHIITDTDRLTVDESLLKLVEINATLSEELAA